MKRSEYISAFLDFVREAQIEYDVARMKQSEADSETQDILHRLELHDDSYHDMARLSKTLKEARQDRRAAKDAISELDPICGWVRENARVLKSLEQLLGNVRKAEKATQNRYYSDRTDSSSPWTCEVHELHIQGLPSCHPVRIQALSDHPVRLI